MKITFLIIMNILKKNIKLVIILNWNLQIMFKEY